MCEQAIFMSIGRKLTPLKLSAGSLSLCLSLNVSTLKCKIFWSRFLLNAQVIRRRERKGLEVFFQH